MSGRHRKPTNTTLCLARVGTLTVMATVPLAIAGTAMAATPTLTDRDSAKWADDDSTNWSDGDSDSDSRDSDSHDSDDSADSDDSDDSASSRDSDDSRDSDNSRDSASSADDETPSWHRHRATSATDDYSPSWRHTSSPSWKEPKAHTWQKPAKPAWKRSDTSSGSATAQEAKWDRLAQCESTQNWDANTGNGYKGGLQFNDATWRAYGGRQYAPTADQASREQQIAVAKKVQREQGWHAWPGCSNKLGYT
jgi:Transglycosylase-like domain